VTVSTDKYGYTNPWAATETTDCALARAFRSSDRKIRHGVALLLWLVVTAMGPAVAQSDAAVTIESPASEETIHDNSGNVPVMVSIKNGDALVAGGAIQALIDGQPYGPRQRTSSFTLEGVERGEHSLQVQLVDSAGKVIASSDAVKFYMWQASALFPGRKR